ncbi:heme oxygenase (biliverdin-producing) [Rhodococcus sp. NPDC003318]|uniref:biliverdin-producing heme oxygenase n=1 Tax=Rhodococcus sp. NPDC003318 TaxID=3364503 RepID=UPI00368C8472
MAALDTAAETAPELGFAERIRTQTDAAHRRTEQSRFVGELLAGNLSSAAHAALIGQTYLVYRTLEDAGRSHANHPVVAPFLGDELLRTPALEADLEFLLGGQWRERVTPSPATARYIDRLEEVAFDWPAGFVAHHYIRYLGDLSGGQIIRRMLERAYGYETDGLRFYIFDRIEKPKLYKDAYRAKLDEAPLSAEEQQRLIDEVNLAYDLNGALFADLEADLDTYLVK